MDLAGADSRDLELFQETPLFLSITASKLTLYLQDNIPCSVVSLDNVSNSEFILSDLFANIPINAYAGFHFILVPETAMVKVGKKTA